MIVPNSDAPSTRPFWPKLCNTRGRVAVHWPTGLLCSELQLPWDTLVIQLHLLHPGPGCLQSTTATRRIGVSTAPASTSSKLALQQLFMRHGRPVTESMGCQSAITLYSISQYVPWSYQPEYMSGSHPFVHVKTLKVLSLWTAAGRRTGA